MAALPSCVMLLLITEISSIVGTVNTSQSWHMNLSIAQYINHVCVVSQHMGLAVGYKITEICVLSTFDFFP